MRFGKREREKESEKERPNKKERPKKKERNDAAVSWTGALLKQKKIFDCLDGLDISVSLKCQCSSMGVIAWRRRRRERECVWDRVKTFWVKSSSPNTALICNSWMAVFDSWMSVSNSWMSVSDSWMAVFDSYVAFLVNRFVTSSIMALKWFNSLLWQREKFYSICPWRPIGDWTRSDLCLLKTSSSHYLKVSS